MIVFACSQCGARFARPEATAGSVLFCACGQRNVVPWESTLPASEAPPVPPPVPEQQVPATPWRPWEAPRGPKVRNPAYCFNHQDVPPAHTCPDCGEKFCADCLVTLLGRTLCGPCKNFQLRQRQRAPNISIAAVLAPIIALVSAPGAVLFLFATAGSMAEGRRGTTSPAGIVGAIALIAFVALLIQLAALLLGAISLRNQEADPRLGGRALAMTGMIAAVVCAILVGEVAVLVVHVVE
jgi:hypothetical protein